MHIMSSLYYGYFFLYMSTFNTHMHFSATQKLKSTTQNKPEVCEYLQISLFNVSKCGCELRKISKCKRKTLQNIKNEME